MKNTTTKVPAHRLSSKSGFTLVEILVVLAIIAALVAGVFASTGGTGARGRATSDMQTCAQLQSNVDRFVQEYGSVPACWHGTNTVDKTLSAAEMNAMIKTITGTYLATDLGTDAALATYCANNPTMKINGDVPTYSTHMTAVATATGTGGAAGYRIVILQYRRGTSGYVANGNGTVADAFVANATACASPYFSGAIWTATQNQAAWPY